MTDYKLVRKRVDVGFYLIFAGYFVGFIVNTIFRVEKIEHEFYLYRRKVLGVLYCIIGFTHLVLGILIVRRLKKNFRVFHGLY